jgi:hypothetical protein
LIERVALRSMATETRKSSGVFQALWMEGLLRAQVGHEGNGVVPYNHLVMARCYLRLHTLSVIALPRSHSGTYHVGCKLVVVDTFIGPVSQSVRSGRRRARDRCD